LHDVRVLLPRREPGDGERAARRARSRRHLGADAGAVIAAAVCRAWRVRAAGRVPCLENAPADVRQQLAYEAYGLPSMSIARGNAFTRSIQRRTFVQRSVS